MIVQRTDAGANHPNDLEHFNLQSKLPVMIFAFLHAENLMRLMKGSRPS